MYCSSCGRAVAGDAQFCGGCGRPATTGSSTVEGRPIAGIAVGAVLGAIGVVWSIAAIFRFIDSDPATTRAAVYEAFPDLQLASLLGASVGLLGNSALLIGVLLAFFHHPKGHKTVRVTSYWTMAALILVFVVAYFFATGASAWQAIDESTKESFIGALIGGAVGGVLQLCLVLFLFRKSRWP